MRLYWWPTWVADPYSLYTDPDPAFPKRFGLGSESWIEIQILDPASKSGGSECYIFIVFCTLNSFKVLTRYIVFFTREKNQKYAWKDNYWRCFLILFLNGGRFSQLDPDPFQIRIRNPAYGFTVMFSSTVHLAVAVIIWLEWYRLLGFLSCLED